jgi:clan AA aspartic protease (TIGR02281 family)
MKHTCADWRATPIMLAALAALATGAGIAAFGHGAAAAPTSQNQGRVPGSGHAEAGALPVHHNRGVFFAKATIDGMGPFWFTVDTGATLTVIDPRTASRLGIPVRNLGEQQNVGTASGPTLMGATRRAAIRVGDLVPFTPARMYVVAVSANEKLLGHQIDGVLGTDFLMRYVMEFDYRTGTVTAHDTRAFAYSGRQAPLSVSLAGNRLLAPSTLTLPDGERVSAMLLIDTGSNTRFILNAPFVRTHKLIGRFPSARMTASVGINGLTTSPLIELRSLRLGAAIIDRPNAGLSRETSGLHASADFDGIIGAELLQSFRVFIDYPRRQMIFEPL